jgi:hypothetical protein
MFSPLRAYFRIHRIDSILSAKRFSVGYGREQEMGVFVRTLCHCLPALLVLVSGASAQQDNVSDGGARAILPQRSMSVTATSENARNGGSIAANVLDGKPGTFWSNEDRKSVV